MKSMYSTTATATCFLAIAIGAGANDLGANRPTNRGLQDLQTRWNIQEPAFEYADLQFSLNWKVSDFIQDKYMDYRVYDGFGCKEGSNDITEESNDVINGTAYLFTPGIIPSALTPHNPGPTSGSGERSVHLRFSIQSENIAQSPIFSDDTSQAQIRAEVRFCVRYSLWNDYSLLEDSVEVNFQETLIYFEVDLTDGFDVGAIQVADAEKGLETANIACEVIGYECYENRTAITDPGFLRNQGSETRICVTTTPESKANGLYLNRINWFYFYRINPDGTVRQNAIIYDSIPAPNGLTDYTCVPGEDPCPFDTILFANFYDRAGVGIVLGEGEATCQYGQSGFDNDIFITGDGSSPGGPTATQNPASSPSETSPPVDSFQGGPPTTSAPGSTPSTPTPQGATPTTPSPVVVSPTPAPVPQPTTAAPQIATAPPQLADAGNYPTPQPCTFAICILYYNCGTEARVLYTSDDDQPLPPGSINIDNQAADGTSVTFTVTQLWQNDDTISSIAILYPDHTEGNNVCPTFNQVAYGESFQHTATCFDHAASNIHLYIEIYIADDTIGSTETFVPEGCAVAPEARKLAYEIYIPCAPCGGFRTLSEEDVIMSAPLPAAVVGDGGAAAPPSDTSNLLLPATRNEEEVETNNNYSSTMSGPGAPGARLAKALAERQRQRKLQEQDPLPPSPFELQFSIIGGEFSNSAAVPGGGQLTGSCITLLAGVVMAVVIGFW